MFTVDYGSVQCCSNAFEYKTMVGGNTDNVTLFLECNLKLASTTEFHVECNSLHYNETAKHCGVISLLPAGC